MVAKERIIVRGWYQMQMLVAELLDNDSPFSFVEKTWAKNSDPLWEFIVSTIALDTMVADDLIDFTDPSSGFTGRDR